MAEAAEEEEVSRVTVEVSEEVQGAVLAVVVVETGAAFVVVEAMTAAVEAAGSEAEVVTTAAAEVAVEAGLITAAGVVLEVDPEVAMIQVAVDLGVVSTRAVVAAVVAAGEHRLLVDKAVEHGKGTTYCFICESTR